MQDAVQIIREGTSERSPLTQIDIKLPLSSQVVVSDWLAETAGMRRTFANGSDVRAVDMALAAHQCEWAEIRPASGQEGIHPNALHMGWGDRTLAYAQPPQEEFGLYMFVAFNKDIQPFLGTQEIKTKGSQSTPKDSIQEPTNAHLRPNPTQN